MGTITFERAGHRFKDCVTEWLAKPHVREFWDTSQEHYDDIVIFMNGRKAKSPYFGGMFTYWVGLYNNEPYSLLMTSEVFRDDDLDPAWRQYMPLEGKVFSIDFMIGNETYLGKGLASLTLEAFTTFINMQIDQEVNTFMIDPNQNNPRAVHVYEKAGFKPVAEFDRRGESFLLMIKSLPPLEI